jgi:hypothetical protein
MASVTSGKAWNSLSFESPSRAGGLPKSEITVDGYYSGNKFFVGWAVLQKGLFSLELLWRFPQPIGITGPRAFPIDLVYRT